MSLTKQKLFEIARPRFEFVDVPGFGKVGIRSVSRVRMSQRESSYRDPQSGSINMDAISKADVHMLIDQVMTDEQNAMFTDDDIEQLEQLDAAALTPLYLAINSFNAKDPAPKKQAAGLSV